MGKRAHHCLAAALAVATCLAAAVVANALAAPIATKTIAGPSAAIDGLGGIAVARDGGAIVVLLEQVDGADRVFASTEQGGKWAAAQQLDTTLPGPASTPTVAAGDGGRFAVAFIDDGELYATVRPGGGMPFSTPQAIAGGASFPDVSMSEDGTAYLSFTAPGPAGTDVYVARLDRTQSTFVLFATPFNLNPAEPAGYNAALRSRVWTATDATALVTWGENNADGFTHVVARRVSDVGPSIAPQDLWVSSLDGMAGADADSPAPTLQDASDWGWIAFRETFMQGTTPVSRVVAEEQLGSEFNPATAFDALTFPTTVTADDPDAEIDGTGTGLATAETSAGGVVADSVNGNKVGKTPLALDATPDAIVPQPQVAIGGVDDEGGVTWLQSGATNAPAAVLLRAFNGTGFAQPQTVSRPSLGAVDTSTGVSIGADRSGEVLEAFLQGAPTQTRVEVGGTAKPPYMFTIAQSSRWSDSATPLIKWLPSYEPVSPITYQLYENGKLVGTTRKTQLRSPAPVAQGDVQVRVVATNGFGQSTSTPTSTITSVTTPPHLSLSIGGAHMTGSSLTFTVNVTSPAPVPAPITSVQLQYGDGGGATATGTGQLTESHAYASMGVYTITVTAVDMAGNTMALTRQIHIT